MKENGALVSSTRIWTAINQIWNDALVKSVDSQLELFTRYADAGQFLSDAEKLVDPIRSFLAIIDHPPAVFLKRRPE